MGKKATLSSRNLKTLTLYMQLRASSGKSMDEQAIRDPIFAKNIGLIESVMGSYQRAKEQQLIDVLLARPLTQGLIQ